MGAVEIADAEMGDAGRDLGPVIGGARRPRPAGTTGWRDRSREASFGGRRGRARRAQGLPRRLAASPRGLNQDSASRPCTAQASRVAPPDVASCAAWTPVGQRRADVRTPVLPFTVIRDAVADLPLPDPAVLREASRATRRATTRRPRGPGAGSAARRGAPARSPARTCEPVWRCTACGQAARRRLEPRTLPSGRGFGGAAAAGRRRCRAAERDGSRHGALRQPAHDAGPRRRRSAPATPSGSSSWNWASASAARSRASPAGPIRLRCTAMPSCRPCRSATPSSSGWTAGGAWFGLDWHHRRIGGRMALGALVDMARGPVLAVSVHLENRSTPAERRAAMEGLLAALPSGTPAIVAGDLNVAARCRTVDRNRPRLVRAPGVGRAAVRRHAARPASTGSAATRPTRPAGPSPTGDPPPGCGASTGFSRAASTFRAPGPGRRWTTTRAAVGSRVDHGRHRVSGRRRPAARARRDRQSCGMASFSLS